MQVACSTAVGVGRAGGKTEDIRRPSRSNGEPDDQHSRLGLFCMRLAAAQVGLYTGLAVRSPASN